jgi:hypothetical protein
LILSGFIFLFGFLGGLAPASLDISMEADARHRFWGSYYKQWLELWNGYNAFYGRSGEGGFVRGRSDRTVFRRNILGVPDHKA